MLPTQEEEHKVEALNLYGRKVHLWMSYFISSQIVYSEKKSSIPGFQYR